MGCPFCRKLQHIEMVCLNGTIFLINNLVAGRKSGIIYVVNYDSLNTGNKITKIKDFIKVFILNFAVQNFKKCN